MFRMFGKGASRKSVPKLTEEDKTHEKKKIETLKAGMLAREALSLCKRLLDAHGPRLSGSGSCLQTADELRAALGEYCSKAGVDDIQIASGAPVLPWKLVGIVYPVVVLLLCLGFPLAGTGLYLLFGLYALREIYWYRPLLEKYQKRTRGKNVWAVIEPEGEATRTLIFGAHHDSARMWRFSKDDRKEYARNVTMPLGAIALLGLECAVQLFTELVSGTILIPNLPSPSLVLDLVVLVAGIPLVWRLRKVQGGEGAPGAGDNLLSGTLLVQLARYYDWRKRCGFPLMHTRLVFASFDGEECGLRGSRCFFQDHRWEGRVEMLNFDCLYHAKSLCFLSQDVNGSQQLDQELASSLVATAKQMGYQADMGSIPFLGGGTDAASAVRAGIPATTMTAVSWNDRQRGNVSHTSDDTTEAIEAQVVEEAISIAIKWIDQHEQEQQTANPRQNPEPPQKEGRSLHFKRLF